MPSTKTFLMAAAAALFATTNAHMIMKTPTPFGKPEKDPLKPDGSNFPCKETAYDRSGISNIMPIGVTQTLSFTGTAVHGGGSCQISLTSEEKPTKDTIWQVIHSIEGGCPAHAIGNLPEGGADDPTTFPFSIPEGISPGEYVLAWTWFNKVGNREMYMNCAPVTVTGGSSKRDVSGAKEPSTPLDLTQRAPSFPNMFVANLDATSPSTPACKINETYSVQFPDPGNSVAIINDTFIAPFGKCPSAGFASGGAPAGASVSPPSPAISSTAAQASVGNVFGPGPSMQMPTTTTAPAVATILATDIPTAVSTGSSAASTAPTAGTASSSDSTATIAGATSCTSPGQEICSPDGKMIGMCDQTSHVVFMAVAPGTVCSNGQMAAAPMMSKRSSRFSREHMRKHHARGLRSGSW